MVLFNLEQALITLPYIESKQMHMCEPGGVTEASLTRVPSIPTKERVRERDYGLSVPSKDTSEDSLERAKREGSSQGLRGMGELMEQLERAGKKEDKIKEGSKKGGSVSSRSRRKRGDKGRRHTSTQVGMDLVRRSLDTKVRKIESAPGRSRP